MAVSSRPIFAAMSNVPRSIQATKKVTMVPPVRQVTAFIMLLKCDSTVSVLYSIIPIGLVGIVLKKYIFLNQIA